MKLMGKVFKIKIFFKEKNGREKESREHEHRPGISALVEGPCAVWSPSSCLAPQVTLIQAILPPQNKYGLLKTSLPH